MSYRRIALILAGLSALGPFSVDTYFPSFPALAEYFGVAQLRIQSTLTVYLVALASMSLFHGAISDSFGRRRVILVSLGIYSAAGLLCLVAPDFATLLALRLIQGLSAGAGMVVGRAVIRDRYEAGEAQRLMAEVTVVVSLAPAVAPILGGWLHTWLGWRGPFLFLSLLGSTMLWACYAGLPESLRADRRQSFHPATLARSYWEAAHNPAFVGLCIALACGGGGFLLYVASAPDFVLNILHLSPTQFGWMFVPIVTGLMSGAALSARMVIPVLAARAVTVGYTLMAGAATLNVGYCLLCPARIPWAVIPLVLYTFGFSLIAPILTIRGLDLMPHRKGLASSLQGFAHVVVFAGVSGVGAQLVYQSALKHAAGMALMMLASWWAYRFALRRTAASRQNANATPPTPT